MLAYWLMKNEPDEFGIDTLAACPGQVGFWDGIRSFQVRNMLRDRMHVGDLALFYHSSVQPPGVAGICEIASAAKVDPIQFDPASKYYDPKSTPDKPRWLGVDVKFVRKLDRFITLSEIRAHTDDLGDFALLRKANRLSVMPVTKEQWDLVLSLE